METTAPRYKMQYQSLRKWTPLSMQSKKSSRNADFRYKSTKARQQNDISTPVTLQNEQVASPHHPRPDMIDQSSRNLCNFVDASLLSKVDLPMFSGSILEFLEFWERFSTLIGNKPHIDDATKFSLLKSSLKGKALHCIQGLPITSANYHIAVDILKTYFDDRVTTRHVLFSKLASLPPCDPTGKELQVLYNQMYALIRQFCTYEDGSKEYGLGAILLNKLPCHVRSRICDKTNNQTNLTPTALIRLLTDIVRKESTLREMESQEPDSTSRYTYHVIHNQTLMIRSKKVLLSVRQKRCNFWSKMNHNSFNCQTYKTASERIQVARNNRICFNCLSGNHLTKDCTSKKTCSHCSKRHHTSLCLRYSQRSLASTPMATQIVHVANRSEHPNQTEKNRFHRPSQRQHHEQQDHIHFSEQPSLPSNLAEPATTLHTTQLPHETVKPPLMCADVVLFNPNNENKEVHVTALLDTGASQSYITNDLIEQLQLQPSNSQRTTMFTFGTEKPMSMPLTTKSASAARTTPHISSMSKHYLY
ncbi:hypothetical protein RB195_004617 [Necator americanus]|uniref:Zinc knuckle n=2 Tax=Necator americanus TaxID=51031 RepID=A0ABR1BIY5_NECAM